MSRPLWVVRTALRADADFRAVLRWTEQAWGQRQARRYAARLGATLARLEDGPMTLGTAERADLGPGMRIMRMVPAGPPARHFLLFRVDDSCAEPTILVLRILHDSMDPARHLSPDEPA